MKSRILVVLTLLTFTHVASGTPMHAVHISFARLEWAGQRVIGSVSFYKDDYLKALTGWSSRPIEQLTASEQTSLRRRYFLNFFRAWGSDVSQPLTLSVTNVREDESSCIFEVSFSVPSSSPSFILDNRVLFREYSDQTNLLMIKRGDREISFSFTPSSPTYVVH